MQFGGYPVAVCVCVCVPLSCVQLFATPWTVATRLLCPWDSPGKNTGVGCHVLLQGIFWTQGLNPDLLHCRQLRYRLSHLGSTSGASGKESAHRGSRLNRCRLIPGSGRSFGEGNDNPPQYSCLGNPVNRVVWWATVHGTTKSDVTEQLSTHTHTHTHGSHFN